jgi:hypothetical protein
MAFDEQGFRKAAAAAGYSADEIESHVAKEKQGAEPKLPEANTYEDFAGKDMANQPSAAKRLEQKASEINPAIPYLVAGGVGALAAAAVKGASKKIYNSLTDKMAADVEAKRVEPQLNTSNKPVAGEPTFDFPPINTPPVPPTPPEPQPKPTVEQLKQKLGVAPPAEVAPEVPLEPPKLSEWASKGQSTTPPEAPSAPAEAVAPPAPVAQAPIETQPVAKTSVEQPVPAKEAVPPPVEEIRTGTGKPAFVGQGPENPKKFKTQYASVHDVPKGYAFVPGANTIDVARNNLGQDVYTQEFSKRDFPATNKESETISNEINRTLGRPTNQQLIEQGVKPPTGTPGITKLIAGKKIVQVGGILGALVALPDIAKAATKGNYAEAGLRAADLATDYIPGVNAAKTSLSGMGLGESPEQLNELGKRLEYIQRTGGGRGLQGSAGGGQGFRGIAPPTR